MKAFINYITQDGKDGFYHTHQKYKWLDYILRDEQYYIYKYLILLRAEEWFLFKKTCRLFRFYFLRKKNKLGSRLGFFIPAGCFCEGLKIYHFGSIIVNPMSKIGSNCEIHGNCLIGNKGSRQADCAPCIGNNVEIGNNAQVIGNIKVPDNCIIAAGAVVVKSVETVGATLVGVPAVIK